MTTIKATVRNGRIEVDEPLDLPEKQGGQAPKQHERLLAVAPRYGIEIGLPS